MTSTILHTPPHRTVPSARTHTGTLLILMLGIAMGLLAAGPPPTPDTDRSHRAAMPMTEDWHGNVRRSQ